MCKYPRAVGAYSVYRNSGNLFFISGQLPINPNSGNIESDDIKEQTRQSLKNIEAILHEINASKQEVLKTTVFLRDIEDFAIMNEVYSAFFGEPYPARSAFAVKELPKGARIEIEVVVSKNG